MANPTFIVERSVYTGFEQDQPQYKCCCGCMHIRTGAMVIGVLEILSTLANIGGLIAQRAHGTSTGSQGIISYSLAACVAILVVILLFVGIAKESHAWVIPHLVFQIIGIIVLIICGIVLIVLLASGGDKMVMAKFSGVKVNDGTKGIWSVLIFIIIIMFFVMAFFEIWWFIIILKFYRYCKDKKYYMSSSTGVQYENQEYGNRQQMTQPLYDY